MTLFSFLPFAAAVFGLFLAMASVLQRKPSPAARCFFAGMVVLAVDSLLTGVSLRAAELYDSPRWATLGLIVNSFVPAAWLAFSMTYSRADYRESLSRRKIPLVILGLLPIVLSLGFRGRLFELVVAGPGGGVPELHFTAMAKVLNVVLLIAYVWILTNLEQTFRSAVGTVRWRIKFVMLGLVVIFGARVYVRSQALLFSTYGAHWTGVESSALLIGCVFLVMAYARTGFAEIDVYPSRAVLRTSLTVLMAGGYLFVVGVLANIVRRFGGAESFQFAAFLALVGMAGFAALLLSDRLRQRTRAFLNRHFARAQHDSVRIWTEFSRRLASVKDQAGLCVASAKLISEVFEVLSVTVWLLDEQKEQFTPAASTAQPANISAGNYPATVLPAMPAAFHTRSSPFDLEAAHETWAGELRRLNPSTFANGGHRWCVPLRAGGQNIGVVVLADRINGAGYTGEELQVLRCIADQVTSTLVNLRLADEVARSRELEAFRTMSAFFVHDLKNAASSLNLMLKNLPAHFDDPAFRGDALRSIGNVARRIEDTIGRLSTLRQQPSLNLVETDLNQLVSEAIAGLGAIPQVDVTKNLRPLPGVLADREQIRSVVTNLVMNAREAVGRGGCIRIGSEHLGDNVVLSVADDGCGMSAAFLRDSLFRPFQSTKKKGLGVGMYQSRMIVEAHRGSIRVESESGKGSTFRVRLPVHVK